MTAAQLMGTILDPGHEPLKHHHKDARWLRWRELKRIKGVRPRRALEIACAVWSLIEEQPRLLPNDGVCLDYAMAHAVLRIRELSGYAAWDDASGKSRKVQVHTPGALVVGPLGREMREALGMFFVQVSTALQAQRAERNRRTLLPQQ